MTITKRKILIVEDSKSLQNLLQNTLTFINYESIIARNGLEALEKLKKNHIDLILLDLEMPVMDGISCIQSIRELGDAQKAKTPVVSVTGNSLDLSNKEFDQLGFTDIIPKPVEFSTLNNVLKKYLYV